MNKAIGLAALAGGVVLLVLGLQANHSFSSDVSRTFTGNPTNNTMWFIGAGIVLGIFGLVVAFRGSSRS